MTSIMDMIESRGASTASTSAIGVHMTTYAFWNNKGGTGKTSLSFQAVCRYANKHPTKKILVLDVCPQANMSELLLGGLMGQGSERLLALQGRIPRASVGGYFQQRLPSPFSTPKIATGDYITRPHDYNTLVPINIDLLAGDPLLELQSNAMSTLANTQIPGTDTWILVIDWLRDFLMATEGKYDTVFVDANPSFSIYTQIALATADALVLPVMADDSSRRAIQNAFSLIYGLKLPSEIYTTYAFATKLQKAGRTLPKVHLIAKNRITQYMGSASAYAGVLRSIDNDIDALLKSEPQIFSFTDRTTGTVDIRDFQTTGVVAFAKGAPFFEVSSGRVTIMDRRVRVKDEYLENCIEAVDMLVSRL